MEKPTILCIDDDTNLQIVLESYLEDNGYNTLKSYTAAGALEAVAAHPRIDAILLDLGLPDMEGLSLLSKVREKSSAPIIIVSGKNDTTDRVVGLEMGADDYITKPFEMRELTARIKAVLRRAEGGNHATPQPAASADQIQKLFVADWCLDRLQYQLFDSKGKSADLTTGEFKLLEALALAPNRALTRDHLFEMTRDSDFDGFDRAVDIQIGRIRKKMKDANGTPDLIKTIRGVGYMLAVPESNKAAS